MAVQMKQWEWIEDIQYEKRTSQAFSDPEDLANTRVEEHYRKDYFVSKFQKDGLSPADAVDNVKYIKGHSVRVIRAALVNNHGGRITEDGQTEEVKDYVSYEPNGSVFGHAGSAKPMNISFTFREDGTVKGEAKFGAFDEHWQFNYREIENNPLDLNTQDLRKMVRKAKEKGVGTA